MLNYDLRVMTPRLSSASVSARPHFACSDAVVGGTDRVRRRRGAGRLRRWRCCPAGGRTRWRVVEGDERRVVGRLDRVGVDRCVGGEPRGDHRRWWSIARRATSTTSSRLTVPASPRSVAIGSPGMPLVCESSLGSATGGASGAWSAAASRNAALSSSPRERRSRARFRSVVHCWIHPPVRVPVLEEVAVTVEGFVRSDRRWRGRSGGRPRRCSRRTSPRSGGLRAIARR